MGPVFLPGVERLAVGRPRCKVGPLEQRPVRFAGKAFFIADPAHVRAAVRKHHRTGLQFPDDLPRPRPIVVGIAVDRARFVGAAVPAVPAIGPVEPHFEHVAVTGQQLPELVAVIFDIFGFAVIRTIPVPRRQVEPHLHPFGPAGVGELPDDIALSVLVRRVFHRMPGISRRPQAETVVVLGREDRSFETGSLERPDPLAAVERRGIELRGIFAPEPPLTAGKGIHIEMQERITLERLPLLLPLRRHRPAGSRRRRVPATGKQHA